MPEHSSFLDSFRQLVDKIFHRDCGESASECQRLKHINEHFARIPAKPAIGSDRFSLPHHPGTDLKFVAYTRDGGTTNTAEMQMEKINEYCARHGYSVASHYDCRSGQAAVALRDAISALEHSAGLIVSDLSRLVEHHDDPLRDLAPLMHENFFHGKKVLVSIKEGIDTATTPGQASLVEYVNELRDIEMQTC